MGQCNLFQLKKTCFFEGQTLVTLVRTNSDLPGPFLVSDNSDKRRYRIVGTCAGTIAAQRFLLAEIMRRRRKQADSTT